MSLAQTEVPAAAPREPVRGTGRRIATSAALIMLGDVASGLAGFAREQTIAALFGVSAGASIFAAASRVPTMVYDLLIGGAMTSALVPVFSEYAARDERAAAQGSSRPPELPALVGAVAGLALALLIPLVTIMVVFARPLMAVLGVGFEPAVQERGILLVRIALPSVVLLGTSAVLMGVLYALHRVTLPAFSAAVYNLGIIACALALSHWLGVTSLVIGVLVGAAAQVALQLPGLRGVPLRLAIDLRHPGVRRILRLYAPVAAGLLVSAAVVTLDTRLASQTGTGSLAAMRYATTLVQFPLGLVATALSFATLPVLSRYGRSGAREAGFRRTLAMGLKAALLLITPAAVGLIVLRGPVVRLVFEHGSFGEQGVQLTSLALLFYAPQLPFVAVDQLLIAAFYAVQNTRLPVLVGVAGAGIYAAVALGTVGSLGMPGLVLANTVQNSAHAVILMLLLWHASGSRWREGLWGAAARIAVAGGAMALVLVALQAAWPAPAGVLLLALYLVLAGAAGGSAYVLVLLLLRSQELAYVRELLVERLRRARRGRPVEAIA
jgi:putative peptidoglycan lipid II flippase